MISVSTVLTAAATSAATAAGVAAVLLHLYRRYPAVAQPPAPPVYVLAVEMGPGYIVNDATKKCWYDYGAADEAISTDARGVAHLTLLAPGGGARFVAYRLEAGRPAVRVPVIFAGAASAIPVRSFGEKLPQVLVVKGRADDAADAADGAGVDGADNAEPHHSGRPSVTLSPPDVTAGWAQVVCRKFPESAPPVPVYSVGSDALLLAAMDIEP